MAPDACHVETDAKSSINSRHADLQCDGGELRKHPEEQCSEAHGQEVPTLPDSQTGSERPGHACPPGLLSLPVLLMCHSMSAA